MFRQSSYDVLLRRRADTVTARCAEVAVGAPSGSLAAQADEHNGWNRRGAEARHMREREEYSREQRWRLKHRNDGYSGYYRQPAPYYVVPPAVYSLPGYHQPPGATLNFSFPFYH